MTTKDPSLDQIERRTPSDLIEEPTEKVQLEDWSPEEEKKVV